MVDLDNRTTVEHSEREEMVVDLQAIRAVTGLSPQPSSTTEYISYSYLLIRLTK